MRNTWIKATALSLSAIIAVCCAASTALAVNTDEEQTAAAAEEENVDAGEISAAKSDSGKDIEKDESVYVFANADGSVKKIIVSDWIKNAAGAASINDRTELKDIENVKGDESYTLGGENSCVWDAGGNDIYYQGNIDKELPVKLSVSYQLDGKSISPEELKGKSGRVTIHYDYENRQYETVDIDGKSEKIYVPFAMLTGVMLDNDVFKNVEVTNGKVINDGSRTAVIGIAFPGLQESLALSEDKLSIPDSVEISADVTDFSLEMTVTLATNEIFSALETDGLNDLSKLDSSMGDLTEAMDKLLDGSSELYDGLNTLLDKSGELADGISQLAEGAQQLKDGAGTLDKGADALTAGTQQLSEGLNTLAANNDTLNGGAKQVFETLLSTANAQIAAAGLEVPTLTIENYAKTLEGAAAQLNEDVVYNAAKQQVTAAVEEQRGYIAEQVTAAVRKEVETQVTAAVKEQVTAKVTEAVKEVVTEQVINAALNMDKATYDALVKAGKIDKNTQGAVNAAVDGQMKSKQVQQQIKQQTDTAMAEQSKTITQQTDAQMNTDKIKQTVSSQTDAQVQKAIKDNMKSEEVTSQLAAAAEGKKSIEQLKASLDSYNTFYEGLKTYTDGVGEAAKGAGELNAGAKELKDGTAALYSGAGELYDGILTLKDGVPALKDGVGALRDGAMQLNDGLKQFNEQGIQKLVSAVDGDIDGLMSRLDAVREVSRGYKNFSGAADGMGGQVKFIYRVDGVK